MAHVYQIRSKINGSSYIGGTLHYRKRRLTHESLLRNNKHENKLLQKHVNLYGLGDLEWVILERCKNIDIIKREQFYTDILNNDFNIRKIVHSNIGLKHTADSKIKMSDAQKGKILSQSTRLKISKANKGHASWNKGVKCTEATRQKISESNKGRIVTIETRKKLSAAGKQRKHSPESVEKRRLKVLGMKMTDEQKHKLSISKRKKVYQYDKDMNFIKEWTGAIDAAKELILNTTCISLCCKGKIKYTGNYIFKFDLIEAKPLL